MCLLTPQQETSVARPRPVFRARSASTPPGFGCARLATLASAPPHPGGVEAEGRKTNYRKTFTPPPHGLAIAEIPGAHPCPAGIHRRLHFSVAEGIEPFVKRDESILKLQLLDFPL